MVLFMKKNMRLECFCDGPRSEQRKILLLALLAL